MNKLSKTKREHLIMVVLATLGLAGGLWYVVVSAQMAKLAQIQQKAQETNSKLAKAESLLRRSKELGAAAEARKQELQKRENGMAPTRDPYGWILSRIKPFILSHKGITIQDFSRPEFGNAAILPKFYYTTATTQVRGQAFYQDLGVFVADFENSFPYFRIQGLDVAPSTEGEQLAFKFDIVTLVQPANAEGESR